MPNEKWTIESYVAHNEALRIADEKFQTERDRRYTEVGIEKEKALKIKEIADLSALELARESQMYKDERNDQMRESSLKNNGMYATRDDLADIFSKSEKSLASFMEEMKKVMTPVLAHISAEQGSQITKAGMFAMVAATGVIVGIIAGLIKLFI